MQARLSVTRGEAQQAAIPAVNADARRWGLARAAVTG
jgi:hypothetical protein